MTALRKLRRGGPMARFGVAAGAVVGCAVALTILVATAGSATQEKAAPASSESPGTSGAMSSQPDVGRQASFSQPAQRAQPAQRKAQAAPAVVSALAARSHLQRPDLVVGVVSSTASVVNIGAHFP